MFHLVLLLAGVAALPANPLEPYFRKDYTFKSAQQSFFKIDTLPRTWAEAFALCYAEGSELAYPETQDEANMMITIMNENLNKKVPGMWIGGHDKFAEGIYVNLDGQDVSELYSDWCEGEPNNHLNNEDCISMGRDGTLNDKDCSTRYPSLCRKKLSTLTANPPCETADLAYVPGLDKYSCYKVHTQPKNWSDAYLTCHAEQSYLTVINSKQEADFLVKLLQQFPDEQLKGQFYRGHIGVGFHDQFREGTYLTVHGKTLPEAGYEEWQRGQPDNFNRNENCGSIARNGQLNDNHCGAIVIFICERDVGDPNVVDLFSRFQDSTPA